MSNSHLDWIWSRYTTSPDPELGMQTLQQTCSMLTKHILQPTHIVLSGGGFTLHPDIAQPLSVVVPTIYLLLRHAAKHCSFHSTATSCQMDLDILTCTTGFMVPAMQNQIVLSWITVIDELYVAMVDLKSLRTGYQVSNPKRERPSLIPEILASLPPLLRVKLPKDFLWSYGIMVLPKPANRAASRPIIRAHILKPDDESQAAQSSRSVAADPLERSVSAAGPLAKALATNSESVLAEVSMAAPDRGSVSLARIESTLAVGARKPLHVHEKRNRPVAPPTSHPFVEQGAAIESGKLKGIKQELAVPSTETCTLKPVILESCVPAPLFPPGISQLGDPGWMSQPAAKQRPTGAFTSVQHLLESCAGASCDSAPASPLSHPALIPAMVPNETVDERAGLKEEIQSTEYLPTELGSRLTQPHDNGAAHGPAARPPLPSALPAQMFPAVGHPAPALVYTEDAVELGGLKAAGAPSLASVQVSPAPTLAVKLGGRRGSPATDQQREDSCADEARTSESRRHIKSSPPLRQLSSASARGSPGIPHAHAMQVRTPPVDERRRGACTAPSSADSPLPATLSKEICGEESADSLAALHAQSSYSPRLLLSMPPAPAFAAQASSVELGGLNRLNTSRSSKGDLTIEKHTMYCTLEPASSTLELWLPALGLVVDRLAVNGSSVELGGPRENSSGYKLDDLVMEGHTSKTRVHGRSLSPSNLITVIRVEKPFALVSAIVRTTSASYLARVRRGELAPCLAWVREGIGTRSWIDSQARACDNTSEFQFRI
ncbi:hypothetical protein B0H13DRAFT_1908631 [Mycena leptocephala]|nr:hypothetical protein B0H13DRAFT_1908631 [Mycena leptocephala]